MRLRTAVPMMMLLLLSACGAADKSAQTPVGLRTDLNAAGGCTFRLELRADYEDYVREYTLDCAGDGDGNATLTVLEPEAAAGITGTVSGQDAFVSCDGTVLAVEHFASRDISPMAAPGLLTAAWGSGHISATGRDGDLEQATYLLGYGGRQLEILTLFDGAVPVKAEISDGARVLIACTISDFAIQKRSNNDGNNQTAQTDLGGGGP